MSPSPFVCRRCGLAVYTWYSGDGLTWKHASGGALGKAPKSQKHTPIPIERAKVDAFVSAATSDAMRALRERSRMR